MLKVVYHVYVLNIRNYFIIYTCHRNVHTMTRAIGFAVPRLKNTFSI